MGKLENIMNSHVPITQLQHLSIHGQLKKKSVSLSLLPLGFYKQTQEIQFCMLVFQYVSLKDKN